MSLRFTSLLIVFGLTIFASSAQNPMRPNYPPIGQFVVPVDHVEAFAISYEPLRGDPTRFLVSFLPVDPQLRTYVNGMRQSLEEIQRIDNGKYSYPAFLLGFRSVNGGIIYPMNLHYSAPGQNSHYQFNPNLPILTPTNSTAKPLTEKIQEQVTIKVPNQVEEGKKVQEKVDNVRPKRELTEEEETTPVFERQQRQMEEEFTTPIFEREQREMREEVTPVFERQQREMGEETTPSFQRQKREIEEFTTPVFEREQREMSEKVTPVFERQQREMGEETTPIFRQMRELVEETTQDVLRVKRETEELTTPTFERQKREVEDYSTPFPTEEEDAPVGRQQRELVTQPTAELDQATDIPKIISDDPESPEKMVQDALKVIVEQLIGPVTRERRNTYIPESLWRTESKDAMRNLIKMSYGRAAAMERLGMRLGSKKRI